MTAGESTETAALDPGLILFGPHGADDPHGAYRQLLEHCPVFRSDDPDLPGVYISDFESVLWALRHPEVFSSAPGALGIGQEQPLIPLQVDPPLHTNYRRLLNPPFTPKRIAELEADVRAVVTELIDGFIADRNCDFHTAFATPLPSTIFLRLMGLPLDDLPTFLAWRDDSIRPQVDDGDVEAEAAKRQEASVAINTYFEQAIRDARAGNGTGLIGELVEAEMEGRRLSDAELLGICHLMLLGGLDTVTATLDCFIVYLAQHPDRRRQLIDDPGSLPGAIEELLRHQTPVVVVPRIVVQDATLGGVTLQSGDPVMLVVGAANADQTMFERADEVDFERENSRHLAFGGGHHLCIGAHLARLELRVALEELHQRIPDYLIADGADVHFSPAIRQADPLPLQW